jgi:hypothetical protein
MKRDYAKQKKAGSEAKDSHELQTLFFIISGVSKTIKFKLI